MTVLPQNALHSAAVFFPLIPSPFRESKEPVYV